MIKGFFKQAAAALTAAALLLTASGLPFPGAPNADAATSRARVSVHDPSVVKDGNTYYVFGSHIDAAKTTDLQNWDRFTNGYTTPNNVEFGDLSKNLKKAFDWAGEDLGDCEGSFAVWAPDVVWDKDYINADGTKGAYLMYFCTSSTWNTSVIAFATAKNIEGPYTFADTLIYSGFTSNDSYAKSATKNVNRKYTSTNIDELIASGEVTFSNDWFANSTYNYRSYPNAIDPTIYYDKNGDMYMVYGSWSGGIFTLKMDPATGKCIHPKSGKTEDGRLIDSYFGTKLSGGYHKSGEGAFIEYSPETGYYYLWETYGGLTSEGGYNMRVFRSKSPTGPFTDPAGRSGIMSSSSNLDSTGLKVMGNYKFSSLDKAYMACGHNSVLRDDDGQWYIFYHARFDDGTEYHEVRVHQMFFNEDDWPVVAPFEYSGDKPSDRSYFDSDLTGDYEFINHGNSTDGKIISSQKITLNADHTISGDVTGTWSESTSSTDAVFTIGKQRYSGVFQAAENEKGVKVMTFTASGSSNQSIWGAQNTAYTGNEEPRIFDYSDSESELVIAPDTVKQKSAATRLSGTDLISGIPYYITNANSGLAIDLPNGKLDEHTNIQQWDFNMLWAQQWRIVSVDDEWCCIVSMGDESKCISVAEDSAADGVNVELRTYTGADSQLFKIVKSGRKYGIVSKCSDGKGALDVFEWSTENGGNINQYAYHEYDCQRWNIIPVHPTVKPGLYTIRNLNSGLYMNRGISSDLVQSSQPTAWRILFAGENDLVITKDTNWITILPTEVCVANGSTENGADVIFAGVSGSNDPMFRIIGNKDGSYSILTHCSDYNSCFDVSESSKEEGANICQWEYTGAPSQKFILEPVIHSDKGDVNADGEVNMADLVMLQNFLLGRDVSLPCGSGADVCEDDKINVFDLCLLKRIIVGKELI